MNQHPSLFISYSRNTEGNIPRVQRLASSLWKHGIQVRWDEWRDSEIEDWNRWVERQIQECRFIIVVCTPEYLTAANQDNSSVGVGNGVAHEATLIRNDLSVRGQKSDRYICVAWSAADVTHKPLFLGSRSHFVIPDDLRFANGYFDLNQEGGYQDLYRRLSAQPKYLPPSEQPGAMVRLESLNVAKVDERIVVPVNLPKSPGPMVELTTLSISDWPTIANWLWSLSDAGSSMDQAVELHSVGPECEALEALAARDQSRTIGAWSDLLLTALLHEASQFWLAAYALRALGFHNRMSPLGRQFLEIMINQQKRPIEERLKSTVAGHFENSSGYLVSKQVIRFSLLIGDEQDTVGEQSLRSLRPDPVFPVIFLNGVSGLSQLVAVLHNVPAAVRDRLKVKTVCVEHAKPVRPDKAVDKKIVESLVGFGLVNESALHDSKDLLQDVYWEQPLFSAQRPRSIAPASLYDLLGKEDNRP